MARNKNQANLQPKGRETYTSPDKTANLEGLHLAHLECYQPRSNEPDSIRKDTSDEFMDLSLPSTTFTP
ncbi:hypothetical protein TNIN_380071 [Trichonephila inaurata madagascariensis]|uniref:Uncharacterized protein n=1 Tax=Trichonephila inaurata madagascariensis TaxID=2747483 RepID=A0A8X6XXI5_9ARAC|nr:hypothetical protein TNIN_380071 [Trichonephila inaurata madagascariensis]